MNSASNTPKDVKVSRHRLDQVALEIGEAMRRPDAIGSVIVAMQEALNALGIPSDKESLLDLLTEIRKSIIESPVERFLKTSDEDEEGENREEGN